VDEELGLLGAGWYRVARYAPPMPSTATQSFESSTIGREKPRGGTLHYKGCESSLPRPVTPHVEKHGACGRSPNGSTQRRRSPVRAAVPNHNETVSAMTHLAPVDVAGVDGDDGAGHVPGFVGDKPRNGIGDVDRVDRLDGHGVEQ
jgi:hypothetical protein